MGSHLAIQIDHKHCSRLLMYEIQALLETSFVAHGINYVHFIRGYHQDGAFNLYTNDIRPFEHPSFALNRTPERTLFDSELQENQNFWFFLDD